MIALVSWVMLDASPTPPTRSTPPVPPTRKRNIRRTLNATPYGNVILQEPNGGAIDLTVNSTVQGNVSLHTFGGTVQTIIHSDVEGDVHAHSEGGSVEVIVRDGAHIKGTIHADAPQSTLQVAFTLQSWDEFYSVQTLLAQAQPDQGEVVIAGQTLRWKNFKQIANCTCLLLPLEPNFMS